jgi:tRNA U38,U39,U40 pseudouridine synthase TruA
LEEIINKKDRKHAGPSAPAHGLYLQNVLYEADVYI